MSKVIYVGAGHSENTAGKRTPDNEREWTFNDKVVKSAIKHLKRHGFSVIRGDDATGKTDISLANRVALANKNKVGLYLSIHHNANAGRWFDGGGTETYYFEGSVEGKKIATLIHKEMLKAYGLKDRGVKKGNHLYEVHKPSAPSVLIEGGFMDSNQDIKAMRNDKVLEKAGEGIARAVCVYFGIAYKEEAPKEEPKKIPAAVKPSAPSKEIIRIFVDEVQVGAFSNTENILEEVRKQLREGKTNIRLEKR